MREVAFIKQNKEKWLSFEQAIFNNDFKDSDELASQYIHLINDLSVIDNVVFSLSQSD